MAVITQVRILVTAIVFSSTFFFFFFFFFLHFFTCFLVTTQVRILVRSFFPFFFPPNFLQSTTDPTSSSLKTFSSKSRTLRTTLFLHPLLVSPLPSTPVDSLPSLPISYKATPSPLLSSPPASSIPDLLLALWEHTLGTELSRLLNSTGALWETPSNFSSHSMFLRQREWEKLIQLASIISTGCVVISGFQPLYTSPFPRKMDGMCRN